MHTALLIPLAQTSSITVYDKDQELQFSWQTCISIPDRTSVLISVLGSVLGLGEWGIGFLLFFF